MKTFRKTLYSSSSTTTKSNAPITSAGSFVCLSLGHQHLLDFVTLSLRARVLSDALLQELQRFLVLTENGKCFLSLAENGKCFLGLAENGKCLFFNTFHV